MARIAVRRLGGRAAAQHRARGPGLGTAARHGLALTFLNAPEADYASAVEPLTLAANDGGYAERGWVLYQLAATQRMVGIRTADPKAATPKFEDALRRFGEAAGWFDGKKNADETDVDCGGAAAHTIQPDPSNWTPAMNVTAMC